MTDTAAPTPGQAAPPRPTRSPAEIEAEIVRTRNALSDSLDVLEAKVSPANLVAGAKAKVIGVVQTPDGALDPKKAAIVVTVVVVLVAYLVRRRRL